MSCDEHGIDNPSHTTLGENSLLGYFAQFCSVSIGTWVSIRKNAERVVAVAEQRASVAE